jgi:hypothetical protein
MTIKTVCISILLLLLSVQNMPARFQDYQLPGNRISIVTGSSIMARQDLIYSPFIHSGNSINSFGLRYLYQNDILHFITIDFSANSDQLISGEMQMDNHKHGFLPHEFIYFSTAYGLGKLIAEEENITQYLGGSLKGDLQAAFYNFQLSEMFGYYINLSLNVWYKYSYKINERHSVSALAELPVISWLARPPYLAEDDEFIKNISSHDNLKILSAFIADGKVVTLNKLQGLNFNLEYSYSLSETFEIGAGYHLSFVHTNEPKKLTSFQNKLNLIASVKF